mmetsp:Transcript_11703/g.34460  ORF Transcript_11703/g.34460 Transcript_11703/m.34460 type:complete len:111 (+) Transcript_11703:346-678(+)
MRRESGAEAMEVDAAVVVAEGEEEQEEDGVVEAAVEVEVRYAWLMTCVACLRLLDVRRPPGSRSGRGSNYSSGGIGRGARARRHTRAHTGLLHLSPVFGTPTSHSSVARR